MKNVFGVLMGAAALLVSAPSIAETNLTIATVNNSDMIRMQGLTSEFTAKNPDISAPNSVSDNLSSERFRLSNSAGTRNRSR